MKGIDKIVARLEADAQAEIDALNADTKAACDKLLAEYQTKADAEYTARVKAGKEACATRSERMASAADLEAKKKLLGFKQELVSDVFDLAAKRLANLPKKEYVDFLAAQAARAAATGKETLIFNKKDAAEVAEDVVKEANRRLGGKGALTAAKETRDITGGVIVKNGDIETNCAIEMLVHLNRGGLAGQVAEILFA